MNVLNDPGEQCCKENGVPVKCIGMCSDHLNDDKKNHVMKQANDQKLIQMGSCKKHWNAIRTCQKLTKGIILIFLTFLSEMNFVFLTSTISFRIASLFSRLHCRGSARKWGKTRDM